MKIDIYTDASVANSKAVTSCLLLTDDYYLGCSSKKYDNVVTSLHGELLGIRDAILYLINTGKEAPATIHCDSYTAIKCVQDPESTKFRKLIDEIHQLESGRNITYELIRGHQIEHNPNKVVDLICNTILNA